MKTAEDLVSSKKVKNPRFRENFGEQKKKPKKKILLLQEKVDALMSSLR